MADYFWPIFRNQCPNYQDFRTHYHTILAPAEKTLDHAENTQELTRALAHSMLGVLVVMILHLIN